MKEIERMQEFYREDSLRELNAVNKKSIISIESSNEEISLMAQQLKDFLLNK